MPQIVEVPGMGEVEFPDEMTDDQISAAIRRSLGPQQPSVPAPSPQMGGLFNPVTLRFQNLVKTAEEATPANVNDIQSPLKMAAALPETAAHLGSGALAAPVSGIAGLLSLPFVGKDRAADITRGIQDRFTYQPRTMQGQTVTAGVTAPLRALAAGGRKAGEFTTDATGSPALGTAVDTLIQASPMVLGIRGGKGQQRNVDYRNTVETIPTKEQLKTASSEAYKRSEDIGAVVSEPRFQAFQKELSDMLQKAGIDKDLHPDATAAMRRVLDEKGPMTLEKIETLRRIAQDAEGSIKAPDAQKAGEIVDAIDSMVEKLAPEDLAAGTPEAAAALKEARNLWSRKRKADVLDELMRRAELSAPNFSASGMENAIRTEFRNLAKNERRFKRFSKEEQAAITRVAKGGPVENVLRFLGKAAPTGVVSTGLGTGLGFMIGGPAGAAAVPAVGALSRLAARGLTGRNARLANELVRAGRSVDDFLGYAALGRSPSSRGSGTNNAAPASIGAGDYLESAPLRQSDLAATGTASAGRGAVPQNAGQAGGKAKSLEQLYLEALIEEMRK